MKTKHVGAMLRTIIQFVTVLLLAQMSSLGQGGFDLRRVDAVQTPTTATAEQRIARGVAFLREELANPSPPRWGIGGGPIDSGYVQQVILGALRFPGAEAPAVLRAYRDRETDPRVKDRITIALARTGAQDTIPELVRILAKEPEGSIRYEAMIALAAFTRPPAATDVPRRVRPGETWKPLSADTRTAVASALLKSLDDPFRRFKGAVVNNDDVYYPLHEEAGRGLSRLGYTVQEVAEGDVVAGWRVFDVQGRQVRTVKLEQPFRKARPGGR